MEKILRRELRRQKQFTQDVLSGMKDLVRVIDQNCKVIFINEPMKNFLGDITGTICYHALGKAKKCSNCISERSIKEGIVVKKEEAIGDKIFSVISSPIRDEDGKIYAAVEVFRDITEKKKMEKMILDQNLKMKRDIDFAKYIQHKMLPKNGIYHDMIKISSKYIPSEMLGGDVFDIVRIDDENIAIYIADVAGHGITASMMTMFTKQALKNLGREAIDPAHTLSYLNERYKELHLDDYYYITILYGVYNKTTKSITFANGGHNCMPIIIKEDEVEELFILGMPISNLYNDSGYDQYNIKLQKGYKILFYTDGITEAKNKEGKMFGEGLLNICSNNLKTESEETIEIILRSIMEYSNKNIKDDIAIMMMEVL